MRDTHIVQFEILRKGPSHNQLISPLTEYLSLCGDFGASVIQLPWEHAQFLRLLADLSYTNRGSPNTRHNAYRIDSINTLARAIAKIFNASQGLQQSIGVQQGDKTNKLPRLIHLRLILSAAELALLPFELSKTLDDPLSVGNGNWLSIQTQNPVCITRQIRNVQPRNMK